jgi:hypothetical protein
MDCALISTGLWRDLVNARELWLSTRTATLPIKFFAHNESGQIVGGGVHFPGFFPSSSAAIQSFSFNSPLLTYFKPRKLCLSQQPIDGGFTTLDIRRLFQPVSNRSEACRFFSFP